MPTRNRAATAARAMSTFVAAVAAVAPDAPILLVAADDSDEEPESAALRAAAAGIASRNHTVAINVLVSPGRAFAREIPGASGSGPGAARNRGLSHLRAGPHDHDILFMFDDDVCFDDVDYRGRRLRCDGSALVADALRLLDAPTTVVGCEYVGRQDLSVLEHVRLDTGGRSPLVEPAMERAGVDNVAPGGISTAFLAIAAPAARLPDFPEHYNEDYVWLHALRRAGWPLRRSGRRLPHVPPGGVAVEAGELSHQFFGEIVWLAVLESERFPLAGPTGLAAAIEEIAGDTEDALADPSVLRRPAAAVMLTEVLSHYRRVRDRVLDGEPDADADRLCAAIANGLGLQPRRPS